MLEWSGSYLPAIVLLCKQDVGQFAVPVRLHGGVRLLVGVVVQIFQVQPLAAVVFCRRHHHQARLERLQAQKI